MNGRVLSLLACLFLVSACVPERGPQIEISGLRAFAPLPGSQTGVAYMTVTNNGENSIVITGVRSPQFERVEMHETQIENGVSRMRPVAEVPIAGGGQAVFEASGLHMMLINPTPDTLPGSPVTLELAYDGNGLLIVGGTLQSRLPVD
jgi:copper(I)-binding protein